MANHVRKCALQTSVCERWQLTRKGVGYGVKSIWKAANWLFVRRPLQSASRTGPPLSGAVIAVVLSACSLLPGTGPTSDTVNERPTASLRSDAALPYALIDVSAETIGFL